ncbi:MAG: chorismate mutase [Pseudohongiellaceae bacterium]
MTADTVPEALLEAREKIDKIDRQLVALMADRFRLTYQVGQLKASTAMEAVDPEREARKLAEIRALCEQYRLDPDFVAGIFEQIMQEVVRNHRLLREQGR